MAKQPPLLYNDKRFDILCLVHLSLDRLDVWERRRKQVKTFKYPGKEIILNYGTFLEEGDLFMITLKDRESGKTQSYPLAFAFEKGTLAVPILNLSDCNVSVPYSVCLGEDGPDAMEAFVPSQFGDKMMVKGMDVKNTEPSRMGSCDKLAKWTMHIPAIKTAAYENFICSQLAVKLLLVQSTSQPEQSAILKLPKGCKFIQFIEPCADMTLLEKSLAETC
jgi:hypothetical protein